jgi:Ca-activated chloride channel family protein
MTFLYPNWLWGWVLVALFVVLGLRAQVVNARGMKLLIGRRLLPWLVTGASASRSLFLLSLQLLALGLMFTALARPRWGQSREVQQETGRNVLLVVDTSRSMLANDVTPDRLGRVRLACLDLLGKLKGDRVGVLAFAGNAYLQAPLTTDHEAVAEAIESLDFTSVPTGGSELGRALELARETLSANSARNHGIILFSDGGEPDPGLSRQIDQLVAMRAMVLSVGVGTEEGSLIPDPDPDRRGDFVRDEQGRVVKTRLEPASLQQVASRTGGRYLRLGAQGLADALVADLFASLQAQAQASREVYKPIERYQWPLAAALVLWMLAMSFSPLSAALAGSRPLAVLLALGCLLPEVALAAWQPSWAAGESQQAGRALDYYQEGDYDEALKQWQRLAEQDSSNREWHALGEGSCAHELKDHDRAIEAFSQALRSNQPEVQGRAHQGLAHSLYDLGDRALAKQPKLARKAWRESLRHFDARLAQQPDAKEVVENREFVRKRLEELEEQIAQQEQQGQKGNKGEKGKKGEKGDQGDGQSGDESGEDQEDRSRKESLGKQEDEEGKGGKEHEKEGDLRAGDGGEEESPEAKAAREQREAQARENARNKQTGFSRNEARSFLRTYADDQKKALQVRPRNDAVKGRDW